MITGCGGARIVKHLRVAHSHTVFTCNHIHPIVTCNHIHPQGIAEFKREIRGMFKKSEAKRQLLMSVAGNRVDTEEVCVRVSE